MSLVPCIDCKWQAAFGQLCKHPTHERPRYGRDPVYGHRMYERLAHHEPVSGFPPLISEGEEHIEGQRVATPHRWPQCSELNDRGQCELAYPSRLARLMGRWKGPLSPAPLSAHDVPRSGAEVPMPECKPPSGQS